MHANSRVNNHVQFTVGEPAVSTLIYFTILYPRKREREQWAHPKNINKHFLGVDINDLYRELSHAQLCGLKHLLEILAAKFLFEKFGEMLLSHWIFQQLLQAERPPTNPLQLDFFPGLAMRMKQKIHFKRERNKQLDPTATVRKMDNEITIHSTVKWPCPQDWLENDHSYLCGISTNEKIAIKTSILSFV